MKKLLTIFLLFAVGFVHASTLSRLKTWTTGEILRTNDLNNEFDNIVNHVNGSLDIANLDSTGRVRFDTLDVTSGLRLGSSPAATLGNVLWGNGSFFISVSKDFAGIVDKTSDQTIAGTKTFSGSVVLGSSGAPGSDVTVSTHIWFEYLPLAVDSLIPTMDEMFTTKFYVDSLRQIDSTRVDSLKYYYGEAGDTTSPGKFYYLNLSDSTWYRASTSVSVIAQGVAVDSVNKGATCRFQYKGLFRDSDYDNIIIPGRKVVNDSTTAGVVAVVDSLRTNTKKMQGYGVALDSITIMLNIDPWVWVWE